MAKSLLVVGVSLVAVVIVAQLVASMPATRRRALRAQLNPNYVRAMAAYKRLEPKLPREELRALTTIGILNGAVHAERQMEQHLIAVIRDLLEEAEVQEPAAVLPKIAVIEGQLQRDQRALQVLTSAMDLVTHKMGVADFKSEMQRVLREVQKQRRNETAKAKGVAGEGPEGELVGSRIAELRQHIQSQVGAMQDLVTHKINNTLDYLIDEADEGGLLATASHKVLHKRQAKAPAADEEPEVPAEIRMVNSILSEADFRSNLVENGLEQRKDELDSLEDEFVFDVDQVTANRTSSKPSREKTNRPSAGKSNGNGNRANTTAVKGRNSTVLISSKNNNNNNNTSNSTELVKAERQEEASSGETDGGGDGGGGGGGLVGLIGSLSGGEGGSDIGALIGALTGLISTLFGPGGLDLESLISTGTSLISGLLAGNRNFGTVLGVYVGTAFDGLSGGGGAINNGQFIGNFLGTVVASLSADPEEDDEPPKPFVFAQNLLSSFLEAKNRLPEGDDDDAERHDKSKGDKGGGGGSGGFGKGGSDSAGFIKQIVAHVVSNALSVVLNAALGASGGSSHASHGLFSGSSAQHSKPPALH